MVPHCVEPADDVITVLTEENRDSGGAAKQDMKHMSQCQSIAKQTLIDF